ncbi:MAG: L,D-transpeptidase family protein [Lentisphaerae bacterium]|nr:L,D-transpeptidase family protein [Lentisphaerota bacterium]
MSNGRYGLERDFGQERPPLWPKLAAVVILVVVAVIGIRVCRNLDRETIGQRRALVEKKSQPEPPPSPTVMVAQSVRPPQPLTDKALPDELRTMIERADKLALDADLAAAYLAYHAALLADSNNTARSAIEGRIGAVALPLVVSRQPMDGKTPYTIQRGDSLSLIARRFGVTQEYLMRANGLADPNKIVTGRDLRTLDHPKFALEVVKATRTLTITLNGKFFKRYQVSVGRADDTPTGTFKIRNRIVNPAWWRTDGTAVPYGDSENILGTRWLGLTATGDTANVQGYGIHGTWDDSIIGRAASAGCIRMRNSDVEELHLLLPLGTPVTIKP